VEEKPTGEGRYCLKQSILHGERTITLLLLWLFCAVIVAVSASSKRRRVSLFLAVLCLSWIGCKINDNPPAYIKEVVAYKEGSDGLVIYIVLADAAGVPTSAEGYVTVCIFDKVSSPSPSRRDCNLFERVSPVEHKDFQNTTIGHGNFQHKKVIFSLGRLTYREFRTRPVSGIGTVAITFRPSIGLAMEGETTLVF
jgi:hypothetical protein